MAAHNVGEGWTQTECGFIFPGMRTCWPEELATNSGVSALIDPVGRVPLHGVVRPAGIGAAAGDEEWRKGETYIGVAKFMRSKTGYEILGDWPWRLAAAAIVVMAFVRRDKILRARPPLSA